MSDRSGAFVVRPAELHGDPKRVFFDGDGLVKVFFHTDKLMMAQFELLPGQALTVDIHPNGDEGYYVAQGTATVLLPDTGEIHEIHTGEIYYIPAGVRHRAFNQHTEKLLVIASIAPQVK
ncbi:MAG TPA: cupin domain-containing protein [Symbiobacteriaceae bacterium]|nr:cupin domain-containing protein [Symbiobacteriaceae bacterium]